MHECPRRFLLLPRDWYLVLPWDSRMRRLSSNRPAAQQSHSTSTIASMAAHRLLHRGGLADRDPPPRAVPVRRQGRTASALAARGRRHPSGRYRRDLNLTIGTVRTDRRSYGIWDHAVPVHASTACRLASSRKRSTHAAPILDVLCTTPTSPAPARTGAAGSGSAAPRGRRTRTARWRGTARCR